MRNYQKANVISLQKEGYKEQQIEDVISKDPSILRLGGDLEFMESQRRQNTGGRLDMLLRDVSNRKRYEVELQLGILDESHIVRAIEYWDIERKLHPSWEHCPVVVAEDVTGRFYNVLGVFKEHRIPLIALQMTATRSADGTIGLFFAKVVDGRFSDIDEEESAEPIDRAYWVNQCGEENVARTERFFRDELLPLLPTPEWDVNFTKYYIGLKRDGVGSRLFTVEMQKKSIWIDISLPQSDDIDNASEDVNANHQYGRYRYQLPLASGLQDYRDLHVKLFRYACEQKDIVLKNPDEQESSDAAD